MKNLILFFASVISACAFAAKIDGARLTWSNTVDHIKFFGITIKQHECEIKASKNCFVLSRRIDCFPRQREGVSWNITAVPNSKWNLSKEHVSDQYALRIIFSQKTTNTYQISSIFVDAPNKEKLNDKRTENAVVNFGYNAKQCKMLCDDFKYSIDPSVLKAFKKDVDLMLNTRTFSIKYKNDKGKLVKVGYDLSELKSVFEILQEEAKRYNEILEFKFKAKADWKF